jgi:hypothetical protein
MRITEVKISDASIRSTLAKYEPLLRSGHTTVQFMNLLLKQPVTITSPDRGGTASNFYGIISCSFTFANTPQRGDFWYDFSGVDFVDYMLSYKAQQHLCSESIKLMVAADVMLTQLDNEPSHEGRVQILRSYLGDGLYSPGFTGENHEVGFVYLGCVQSESYNETYVEVRTFRNNLTPRHINDKVLDLKAAMTLLKATGNPPIALLIQNKHTPSYPENSPISFEGRFSGLERVDNLQTVKTKNPL